MPANKVKQVTDHIVKLQEYVSQMTRLQVDEHEYAYLKAIALFSVEHPDISARKEIVKLQEKSFQALRNYVNCNYPEDSDRFPRCVRAIRPPRIF